MKRGNQTEVRRPIVGLDLFMSVVTFTENNWLPLFGLETPIDAICFCLHLRDKIMVLLDVGAARSSQFHERQLLLIGRVFFQKPLDSSKPFENAFRVVYPVDSYSQV